MKLTLYTGPQCSLCEQAQDLIAQLDIPVELEKVNIRDSAELYHLYAMRIPVIKKNSDIAIGAKDDLGWPFSLAQLRDFVK